MTKLSDLKVETDFATVYFETDAIVITARLGIGKEKRYSVETKDGGTYTKISRVPDTEKTKRVFVAPIAPDDYRAEEEIGSELEKLLKDLAEKLAPRVFEIRIFETEAEDEGTEYLSLRSPRAGAPKKRGEFSRPSDDIDFGELGDKINFLELDLIAAFKIETDEETKEKLEAAREKIAGALDRKSVV